MRYRTKDGDRLDQICHSYYGSLVGTVEAVLEANPGLSLEPGILPVGLEITLPELETPATTTTPIRVWS